MLTCPLPNKRQMGFVKLCVSHSPQRRFRPCPTFCGVNVELRAACESLMKRRCCSPAPIPSIHAHIDEGVGQNCLLERKSNLFLPPSDAVAIGCFLLGLLDVAPPLLSWMVRRSQREAVFFPFDQVPAPPQCCSGMRNLVWREKLPLQNDSEVVAGSFPTAECETKMSMVKPFLLCGTFRPHAPTLCPDGDAFRGQFRVPRV